MYMVVVDSVRYNMLMLCYTVLLTLCVLPRVPVDAIIKRDYGCSKIYSGSNGEIFSPDYPQEYPNNLVCAWAIKAPYDTRIRVTFTDFRLERSDDCFDRLIVKDGIQSNSPVIGTFCATDGLGVSLTSSGNTLLLNFVTDASLGERGIKINWESISKISLQQPTDGLFTGKWQGIEAPKDIISFDAGLQENTVWAIDKNKDIFFYDGQKWNIQPGKLQSITVGEAGIFGIYPGNQSIFWRYGAGLDSPLGYRWQFLSGNGRKIVKLESGFPGVLYGIDDKNTLLYLSGGIFRDLDMKWKKVPLNLENGGEIEAPLTQISCGMYSCFLTTKEGDVYGMTTPGNPEKAKWIHDFGNFKNVTIGYGNNAWALDSKGNIHKKDSLNNIHMMGKDWKNQYFNLNIREIAAGLTGVYALARDGSFGRVKDSMCGGFVFDRSGTISSPNYPALYPPNQSCLWVIRPKGAKIIDLNFESQFEIKASPLCKDYLTTTYPGITEPIVECGKTVVDKRIQAEQVWIEFVSDATTEGIGFKINFESADPSVKRLETTTTAAPKVTTTLPKGWEIFKPDEYFQKKFSIKDMNPYSKSILWGLTDDGQAFIKTYGTTRLIPGEKMKSLATNGLDVWAIDANNNLVIRTDVSGSKPEGDSWKVVERYTLYKKIASGAAGHYTVLYDNNELHYCVFDEKASPDCQLIAKKVKSSSSSSHGTWFIDNNDNLFFAKVVRKPDNKYDFITKNLRVKVNDVKVTKTGDVWALFKNNTLASRKGVSFFKPYGLKWEPKQIVGVKMHVSYDNVHVVLKDGRIISLIDPVRALPEKWDRIKNNVNTPYKIDAYPKEDKIDVWVLGGLNGRIPYQGTYDINGDDEVKFERRGDVELKSISVGESGVWGIGYKDLKARYFDRVTKKWQTIPNDGKNWEVIESASPINNVYAIDYEFSELYFRDGISGDNPVGTKWVYIGLSATQISSGSHATYLVTDDGALKSFSEPPTSNKLKTWLSGLKSYLNEVSNTFSVGFGGVVAFLDEDNDVVERNILLPKDELNDKIWIWGLNRGVGASDISAGPVIFGIVGNDIIAKKVTTCFGYYHNVKNSVTVRLSKTRPGVGKCTWIVTSSKPTTMNALLVRQNFQESQNCDNGGLFYSTNHASPLLGEFKEFCRNANFQEAVKGNRMFFQYMKPVPLSIDQMELKFDVLQTESGCGGTFTDNSGRVSSGKYPENYPNNQDCTTIIKADTGKVIQLTIEKMDIEYGGTACDYDYLQINNGQYPTDPLMGKFCGKKSDLQLTSSGNAVRILFKSDDSGNAKGFTLTWKIIGVTTTPVTTTQTAQAGCGGTFTSSTGKFTSQNWPQNYPTNQNCKWSITVPAGKKVTLTLEEVDIEEDQSCLYDYLIAYDGLIITDKYNEKICGRKFNYQIQSADNEMLVVFRSDSSTVRKGFTASWNTEEMTKKPTTTVPTETTPAPIVKPSDWDEFNSGYKFKKLKSDYKGVLWGIKKDDNKIYTIDRSGTPPTLVSYLSDVYTISLGKYSVQKNGAWALAGPNRDIYFFNISNYDKEPWEKVGSIDGSKNADIVTTLFHTFLIKEDGHIFYRQGITRSNPKGDQWYLSDRGNGIDEAIFGTWLIDGKGDLRFKKFGTREFVPVDKPDKYLRSNKPFTQIVTGYGNRVFAVINGELFKRDGVSFANPSGLSWKSTGVKGVRDTTNNNLGVFVILEDERMVKLEDVVCGGILTNKEGQIKYPEFQNSYTPNQYCMYYLKLNGVENIEFSQRWFELENSRGCTKDRVTIGATQNIQNGIESTAYCASGLPNGKLVVEGGEAFIEFLSDDDVNRRGFSFDYSGKSQEEPEIKECGGEFRSDTGRFQSTRYPRSYSANENCEWKIATRENTRILITFDDMNIKSRSCGQEDYLQVFDGSSSSSEILKIYCDENAPQMIRTSGNKVLIKFKTDGSSAGRGFSGNWRAEPIKSGQLGCGDTFTALSGTLRSPNFPNKYNNYADCTYLVRLKPGNKITLKFAKFNVEKSDNCDRDYVNIYNVETNGVRRLANKLCGSDLVKDFESESNKVDVEFKSDGTSSYPGFDIRYLDSDTDKNPVYPSGWNAVSGPEHMFVQLDAIVESSGAWALDSNGIVYHFSPADKKWTSANYLASDLSLTPGKYGVYALKQNGELYFRDGISSVKPAGKYWRRIIPDNNVLTVVDYGAYGELVAINKDGDVLVRQGVVPIHKPEGDKWVTVARGFKSISVGSYGYWLVDRDDNVFFAKYVSSNELDRLRLSQVNGKFRKVSAGFGGNVWAIDKNNRVFMRINVNSLNPSGSKWTEVPDLALTDIASGYDAVYGITLSGRVVRFTDTYCGGLSTSPTGSFSSPNFPLYYPANKNCLYVIRVPGYNKIDTDVVQFALESSSSCRKDYLLTSRDGQFPSNQQVQISCGKEKSNIPKVFKNKVWFEFSSDKTGEDIGFFIEWKASRDAVTPTPTKLTPTLTKSDGLFRSCGGTITEETGTIVHPNYPGRYANRRDCRYAITVRPDKVVRLIFEKIDMENADICRYDYVEVEDSFNYETKRYCQNKRYEDFISSGRSIVINFRTDQAGVRSGFKILWMSTDPVTRVTTTTLRPVTTRGPTEEIIVNRDCGKVYRDFSGYIYHPSYPMGYKNNLDCIWTVVVPRGDTISLEFQFFKLESSVNCENDFVAIYDGASDKSPLVNKYCGSDKPADYKSKKNVASVRIKTNEKKTMNGFVVLYRRITKEVETTEKEREECGSDLTDRTEGYITSPNFPNNYDNDRDCFYTVKVKENSIIKVEFIEFDIEESSQCKDDSLVIRSGGNVNSRQIGKYCGSNLPQFVRTSGNKLFVRFITNGQNNNKGFRLYWKEEVAQGCRYDETGDSGIITSPGYPNQYGYKTNCYWYITGNDRRLQIEFEDFELEDCQGDSAFDYVRIIDGTNTNGNVIGKFCGGNLPAIIKTSSNKAIIHFRTDDRVVRNGFKLRWKSVTVKVPQTLCSEDLTGTSGVITHPNYPDKYNINKDCKWRITVGVGKKIQIKIREMIIEGSSSCKYDYVQIKDGLSNGAAELGKFCGSNLPTPVSSTGNTMMVRFYSDEQYTKEGFKLEWKELDAPGDGSDGKDCKFNLSGIKGEIKHVNYPKDYAHNKTCGWRITVPKGDTIKLRVIELDLEATLRCTSDSLTFRDGGYENSKLITKLCGVEMPPYAIKSTGNYLYISFISDHKVTGKGFKIIWEADGPSSARVATTARPKKPVTVCQYVLHGSSGNITHTNGKQNKDCFWSIISPAGTQIRLSFMYFNATLSQGCLTDYLIVRDREVSLSYGGFCGNKLPNDITSKTNTLYLQLHTSNPNNTNNRFVLNWKAFPADALKTPIVITEEPPKVTTSYWRKDECRETATGSSGRISSPNYPRNYDVNKDCYWIIESSPRTTIKITFNDIDTESSGGSCYDYVELFDGSTTSSRSLGKFCGSRIPRGVLKSRGNRLLVRFYSDDRSPKKGFQLTWKSESKLKVATSKCEKEAEGVNTGNAFLRGAFTPQCRDDGFYEKKQCHSSTGYCWCVGITTGREILGTRKAPGRGSPSCVISKCEQEIMENKKRESSGPGMVGAFVPECKENGNYEKKQCHGSTGHCWCVEPVTGQEITGTRKGPGKGDPECHLSACQREEKTKSKTNILGAFIPKCKVDGSFEDKQCHGSIGHCWCVEPKTGKEVSGTRKRPGEGQPTCGLSKCQREAAEVIGTGSDIYRVKCKPDGSYYKKQCYAQRGSCWCVDQETGKEVEGTWRGPKDGSPECGDEDKCNPACPYNYEPVCGSNGKSYSNKCLFKYEKCTNPSVTLAYEGECSGVDSCNRACPFNWEPVCGSNGKSYSNPCLFKIEQCKNPSMKISYTGTCTDGNDCKQACGFNYEPVCGTDGLSYSNECVRKLAECRDPRVKLAYTGNCKDCLIVCPYDYEPVCGTDGKSYSNKCLMKNAQCKDSSIKVASNGQCGGDLSKCQQRRKDNQNLLGSFVPTCKDDGSYDEKQCHGSIGECWCVDSKTGQEVGGSRTRRGEREPNCDLSECQKERKSKNGRLGAFIPRCKSDGSYEDKQCHGSTGHCWCVNSITGTEIQGTRKGPGKGVPSCNCLSVCPYNYEPVCGSNGKTYSNQCMLKNAKCKDSSIRLDSNGQCSSSECDRKICTKEYRPMCGSDKVTYSNPCLLQKAQCVDSAVTKAYDGACRDGSATIRDNQPIYRSSHRLSGDSGIIAHPGYPTNYENGVYSTWLINADPSNKIRLYFDTFSLQSSSGCSKDYVEVYDGDKTTDRRIGKYCSTNPGWIVSTGSQMLVVFRTNSEVTNSGFYARWNTEKRTRSDNKYDICGSKTVKFDGNQIEVHSPNFNGYSKYPRNRRCVLQLTHLPNTVFQVDVVTFFLQRPTPFCRDYLSIRDGDNKNSKELGRMCGQNVVKKRLSTNDNKIFLEFVSDGMTEDRGFSIFISSSERPRTQIQFANDNQCGQTLNGPRGVITNPSSLPVSTRSSVCVWQIETTPNTQIQLKFDLINLSDDCEKSYIIVRDGKSSEASTIRQKLCGYKTDVTIASQGNNLWLEYKTPHSDIGQFVVRWSENGAKDFKCGGTVSGSNGYLTTPFYPRALDDDVFCLWIIMAEPKKRVSLTLQDTRFGPNCVRSYTIVRDGTTSGSMQLGKFCSNSKDNIVSSGNSLWVELKATCMSNKAFKAFWAQVEDTGLPGAKIVTNEKSPGLGSGGIAVKKPDGEQGTTSIVDPSPLPETVENIVGATIITNSKGVIKSPFFPKNYPHDHVKVWILRGPKPGKIRLQFTTFDIESDSHCLYDYVEIRDGGNVGAPMLGRFCGEKLPDILESSGDKLWIKFRSDSSTHASGFSADWRWIETDNKKSQVKADPNACGGVFTTGNGVITSPKFPDLYPNNLDCIYIIKPPQAKNIQLEFNTFDLEADYKCSFDYLEVKDGSQPSSPLISKLCDNKIPNAITTKNGAFWIRLKSDVTRQGQGFSASWKVLDNTVQ